MSLSFSKCTLRLVPVTCQHHRLRASPWFPLLFHWLYQISERKTQYSESTQWSTYCVIVNINDQYVFRPILVSQRSFNLFTDLPFMLLPLFTKRLLIFSLLISDLLLTKFKSEILCISLTKATWSFFAFTIRSVELNFVVNHNILENEIINQKSLWMCSVFKTY